MAEGINDGEKLILTQTCEFGIVDDRVEAAGLWQHVCGECFCLALPIKGPGQMRERMPMSRSHHGSLSTPHLSCD